MPDQAREPSLADVAARAGVSPTTVSRVLNNRGYLSQHTKDAVAQAIDELQYRPNQVARSLLGQKTKMIGVIMPTVALPFFGEVAVSLEHALAAHGYRTLLCNSLGRIEFEREYLKQLQGQRVDGIVSGAHNDAMPEYARTRMPVVTIDRDLAPHIPNVRSDNLAGARLATELLLRRGARRPVFFTASSSERSLRRVGYQQVMDAAGIEPTVIAFGFHTPEPERSAQIYAALDAVGEFDAVFATDDLMAGTVLAWARRSGRRVPDDLRVIGYDGTEAMRRAMPWLSTVQQPITRLCRVAVDTLIGRIDNGVQGGEEAESLVLPVRLLERETT